MGDPAPGTAETYSMLQDAHQTDDDRQFSEQLGGYFDGSLGTVVDKLRNFAKYVPRQALGSFLAKSELMQTIIPVHGHIIECGVFLGGGLMTWAQLSAIFEPYNHQRRIVGFDTFDGFTALNDVDATEVSPAYATKGGLATHAEEDIRESIRLFDLNRPIGHISRTELVVGDATKTIEAYVHANPHLVVAMLYLDFDLFDPTKAAIENLLPRMPKGAVLAFDELGQSAWPGETLAVLETIGLRNLRVRRFPFTPSLSYAVLD